MRQRKAVDVARMQDAHGRLQEIAVEAGQLGAPDLQAAAVAAPGLLPSAPAEDEQWPVTVTVRLLWPLPYPFEYVQMSYSQLYRLLILI